MTSILCMAFTSIKLLLLHSIWFIVPTIYSIGLSQNPTYLKNENIGDIIFNCAPIGGFYL